MFNGTVQQPKKLNWRNWVVSVVQEKPWGTFKQFCMLHIEICRLLISVVNRPPKDREALSHKMNNAYNTYADKTKLISRKSDPRPDLDKFNFHTLQDVLYS